MINGNSDAKRGPDAAVMNDNKMGKINIFIFSYIIYICFTILLFFVIRYR